MMAEQLSGTESPARTSFGYHGRYLRVDLGSGSGQVIELPPVVLRQFLGGSGLGVYLMLREGAAAAEPL